MSAAAQLKLAYTKSKKRKILAILSIFVIFIIVLLISLNFGAGDPRLGDVINVFLSKLFPFLNIDPGSELTQSIVMNIRLPRIVLAIIAGVGLAASGATMQGALRNPLVSSYTLGISAGAGFGAALAIVFQLGVFSGYSGYVVIVNAFVFSLVAMLIVFSIGRLRGVNPETIILTGVAVNYLFSALLSFIQYVTPEHEAVRSVVFWLLGSFVSSTWTNVLFVLPFVAITSFLMMRQSWDLNALSLGEETATSVGVNSKRVISISMVLVTLATASIVAFTGIIGFISLVSPHIARMFIGNDHRFLIPCSVVLGSCLLLFSDTLSRLILYRSDIPVGILTALLGVPFFLYLLLSKRRQNWS
ncbi:MAG: iron ABC transporter permease [Candidatus Bathyarchaeota archaeon]|nr:iron ABC transporter permease [Candidatus Bathyarchaeota archaeon]